MRRDGHVKLVAELFKSAVEIDPEKRRSFLDDRCGSNWELRAEVDSLLRVQDRAGKFMERSAIDVAAKDFTHEGAFAAGQVVDDYEIISLIGKGGMGEVYLAQDRQLQRRVALKLVRRGMDTDAIVRRFLHEQRLLASLNHPNIAQLYGAGVTEDGIPFFAMEYVAGTRIDVYCRQKELGVSQRLELFCKVCAAVQYAHQHLVVHRDLKPSNILVTDAGEPKLLDFGIAKLLDTVTNAAPEQTITLQNLLTPEYASPEHVRGEPITTASDVYSLGVLLYELLTEAKPYTIQTRTPVEIARVVTEVEPERPSTAAANSKFEIRNSKFLRGDLDNIVLMAMRKEPPRRYASASGLAEDIRRHLSGLPVRARKDTVRYRASKFVRRHRLGVIAAVLVISAIVAGFIATLMQARRAERERARAETRFNDVRALANSLLWEIMPKFMYAAGTSEAREIATKRATEYLDRLASEPGSDPALQRELALAYRALADTVEAATGDVKGGMEMRRKALTILEALVQASPKDLQRRDELARHYVSYGWFLWLTGDSTKALEIYDKTLALRKSLIAEEPQTFDFNNRLAHLELSIGDLFSSNERIEDALQHYREALRILETLHPEAADNQVKVERNIVYAWNGIGDGLSRGGDYGAALEQFARALEIAEPLAVAAPHDMVTRNLLRQAYSGQAHALRMQRDYVNALEKLHRCRALYESVPQPDANLRTLLADLYSDLGITLSDSNDLPAAQDYFKKAVSTQEQLIADGANSRTHLSALATTYQRLGALEQKLANSEAALAYYERSLPLREQVAADPLNAYDQKELAACREQIEKLKPAPQ